MFSSLTPGHGGPLPQCAATYARLDALKARLDAQRPLAPEVVKTCMPIWWYVIPTIPTPLRATP